MKVKSLRIRNFRSFDDSGAIELASINVFVGENNSGKSSVLRALHQLQLGLADIYGDVRVGTGTADIEIQLQNAFSPVWPTESKGKDLTYHASIDSDDRRTGTWESALLISDTRITNESAALPNVEPNHFIVPYLSKRKATHYVEDVREENITRITSDVSNLAAKLSRLGNAAFPSHETYAAACKAILGVIVTAIPSLNGLRPGIYIDGNTTVPIDQMGEGVPSIVHLLSSLATSRGKLFLIEELENDLHPSALKALLDLIVHSSEQNQFVISTHSNIVVRHLCGQKNSNLFHVSSGSGLPTTSKVQLVPESPEARLSILQELGYTLADFYLWEGWIILEESSAERVVRDYLIPWFAPKLSRVRTMAAGGISQVEPALSDFIRLVVFAHLQPTYKGRTWVFVDDDDEGQKTISGLREKYVSWDIEHFQTLKHKNFEHFYPEIFSTEVNRVLTIPDQKARRQAKNSLLHAVIRWLDEDVARGREALSRSSSSLIENLKGIEQKLFSQ